MAFPSFTALYGSLNEMISFICFVQEFVDYYGDAGVQHIAINTDDIISAVSIFYPFNHVCSNMNTELSFRYHTHTLISPVFRSVFVRLLLQISVQKKARCGKELYKLSWKFNLILFWYYLRLRVCCRKFAYRSSVLFIGLFTKCFLYQKCISFIFNST